MFRTKYDFIVQLEENAEENFGKDFASCSTQDRFYALADLIASKAMMVRTSTEKKTVKEDSKKIYYFSMEFLIGKLLDNYLINLGIRDIVVDGLAEYGETLEALCERERDPGLGNGGLGRLAACFIDSMASLGYMGNGNGIRYRFGLFKQEIENGRQVEKADNWLAYGYPWERRRPENAVEVRFGGHVERDYSGPEVRFSWVGGEKVLAVPYDVPVLGYGGETSNTLRLWSAEPCEERFDMDAFNNGDYAGAQKYRADIEAITSILYPNDNGDRGKILRIKQEYLFTAAGLATILKDFKEEHGDDFSLLPKYVAIHTNDTHPALCAPELMRKLVDEEGLSWDVAWEAVVNTISYTNHTILPEALEKWPIEMIRELLPRVYDFIEEIDRRYCESFPKDRPNWHEMLRNTAILWDGQVRMANLSVIAGHSVNGVAALHTEILKNNVLKDFYSLMPEKFNNKTNGVSHRRFLLESNPSYSELITSAVGPGWIKDMRKLEGLLEKRDDPEFLEKVRESKRLNKARLAAYIEKRTGLLVDPDSIFDIQVKRFHAYKRQLLNVFKVMDLYNRIREDESFSIEPVTFIFAGKAAQGYDFAKDCIRLIHSVAEEVNNDPRTRGLIKVVFIPNFAVSNAQLIYPAADISEQISTAGMEASGTSNMKFMMNGAVTLGTLDGSTVEIAERVGEENIKIFGLRAEEVEEYRNNYSYIPRDLYNGDPRIHRVCDQLVDGSFEKLSGNFNLIFDSILRSDEFFVLRDFNSYMNAWYELNEMYKDKERWTRMSVTNTAKSWYFSSDRTIREYADDIWNL
ncbi:MAG: glycogen/starch/alpha-glucan phosphorylase [Lachnospiraceae bacterium]|nr:glycogen/starch/alpha-glucan phosphorylase [Lachnospiraceae bacterium]